MCRLSIWHALCMVIILGHAIVMPAPTLAWLLLPCKGRANNGNGGGQEDRPGWWGIYSPPLNFQAIHGVTPFLCAALAQVRDGGRLAISDRWFMLERCIAHPSLCEHNDWERMADRWKGETVVCIASGPSLTQEDVEYVRGKAPAITVNNSFLIAPWADVHYSSDHDWWEAYHEDVKEKGGGEKWTGHHHMGPLIGAFTLPYNRLADGLTTSPQWMVWGGNSGYCALQMAYISGASRIIMLGYDMSNLDGKTHWHGLHERGLRNTEAYSWWIKQFNEVAKDFQRRGVVVLNASRNTALECFPRMTIQDVL